MPALRASVIESVFIRVIRGSTVSDFSQIFFDEQQVAQEWQREQRRKPAHAVACEQAHLLDLVNLRLRQSLQLIQLADVMVRIGQQGGHREQHHCDENEPPAPRVQPI